MKLRVFFLCVVLAVLLLALFWYAIVGHYQGAYIVTSTRDTHYGALLTKAFVTAYALAILTAQGCVDIPRQNVRVTQSAPEGVNISRQ